MLFYHLYQTLMFWLFTFFLQAQRPIQTVPACPEMIYTDTISIWYRYDIDMIWISMYGYPCMDIHAWISMHGYPFCYLDARQTTCWTSICLASCLSAQVTVQQSCWATCCPSCFSWNIPAFFPEFWSAFPGLSVFFLDILERLSGDLGNMFERFLGNLKHIFGWFLYSFGRLSEDLGNIFERLLGDFDNVFGWSFKIPVGDCGEI